jgi:antitoxin MazE
MSRINTWGNSHGTRIPREVLAQADIAPESEVTITAEAGRIVIEPARRRPTLAEPLAKIRPGDRFDEVDYGAPRGREVL